MIKTVYIGLLSIFFFSSCAHKHKGRLSFNISEEGKVEGSVQSVSRPIVKEKSDHSSLMNKALEIPRGGVFPTQVLERLSYTLSYNSETKNPNWVAWHLTRTHTDGPYSRKGVPYYDEQGNVIGVGEVSSSICRNGYFVDLEVPPPRQEHDDWRNNEYHMSHGHMCPAGDNKWDKTAMNQSFLLTNMCPQEEKLNNGGWKTLEEKCRTWAIKYGDIYIVAGPIYNSSTHRTIGENKIAVPDAFFKVVLCINEEPKALGFIYPNDTEKHLIRQSVCSVDEVERITGFDFFFNLPDEIEKGVEENANLHDW